jgi:hypothetical protein
MYLVDPKVFSEPFAEPLQRLPRSRYGVGLSIKGGK